MRNILFFLVMLMMLLRAFPVYAGDNFTQNDRELLIEMRTRIQEIDKRFEQIDKRFEQVDKRLEQVDKRITELREDMNKRFEDMFNFLWIITGIFTTLTVSVIGFAYWDRRTIIRTAKEETIAEIEKEGKVRDMVKVLKELSRNDTEVAKVLRQFNLL